MRGPTHYWGPRYNDGLRFSHYLEVDQYLYSRGLDVRYGGNPLMFGSTVARVWLEGRYGVNIDSVGTWWRHKPGGRIVSWRETDPESGMEFGYLPFEEAFAKMRTIIDEAIAWQNFVFAEMEALGFPPPDPASWQVDIGKWMVRLGTGCRGERLEVFQPWQSLGYIADNPNPFQVRYLLRIVRDHDPETLGRAGFHALLAASGLGFIQEAP